MKQTIISYSCWSYIVNGILTMLYGILALSITEETLILIVKYAGIVISLFGIVMGFVTYNRYQKKITYSWLAFESVLFTVFGFVIFFFTRVSISFVVVIVGLWVAIAAITKLFALINIPKFSGKNLFLAFAVLFLVTGILIMFYSFRFATALVFVSGIFALAFGLLSILFAVNLLRLKKQVDNESNDTIEIE